MNIHNINKTLLENKQESKNDKINKKDFLNEIKKSLNDIDKLKSLLTIKNLKDISLEDIENMLNGDKEKLFAKNLKLSTMFSKDEILTKVMYETVLNKPLDLSYYFLKDRYEDKFNFLNYKNESLASFLHESMTYKLSNKSNTTDVIEKDKLDSILEKVYSFDFLSAFSNTSKNQYDRYKDKNSEYAFLYNNYHLEYQELMHKYKDLDNYNKQMLKKF